MRGGWNSRTREEYHVEADEGVLASVDPQGWVTTAGLLSRQLGGSGCDTGPSSGEQPRDEVVSRRHLRAK
ncbi:MAG: hypothetical protein A3B14_00215 [Candidatus Zambryskibacteria bacterium RIFCSPLOWO2_01_FULL_45_21]|uniref:Uncharacterized protein n=1 Tax=Candidatus Zambryskibacteria bacterium RIFCSPLOWO2_01_FULL_45_21 TaxID=1802761 RepID=A0A1G2U0R3_9BACT|nr:MAG: hypothetical protein A3B14_00215 [Candidatus Zambryskibacteria bacterium RIFCSPLOWO2_01_FULL_45_21]